MNSNHLDIRQHLFLLANCKSQEILKEIQKDHDQFLQLLKQEELIDHELEKIIKPQLAAIDSKMKTTEKQASSMKSHEQRMNSLEMKSGVQNIFDLNLQLKKETDFRKVGQIKRELDYLKSIHANTLSEIASNRQQIITHRITIIEIWRDILGIQLDILEENQKRLIKKIYSAATDMNDENLLEIFDMKLKEFQMSENQIKEWKKTTRSVFSSNISALRDTLKYNLQNFVKIEKTVTEKRMTFQKLAEIAADLKKEIHSADPQSMGRQSTTSSKLKSTKEKSPLKEIAEKPTRMVYQNKRNS